VAGADRAPGQRIGGDLAAGADGAAATVKPVEKRARDLSRLYEEVASRVKALVDQADPEGLLAMGVPSDEYDDAVAELTRRVLKRELDQGAIKRWFDSYYGETPIGAQALVRQLEELAAEVRTQNARP
jgi:hypothetical protein